MENILLTEGERLVRESLNRSPNAEAEVKRCRLRMIFGSVVAALGLALTVYLGFFLVRDGYVGIVMFLGGMFLIVDSQWRLKVFKVSLYAKSLKSDSSGS